MTSRVPTGLFIEFLGAWMAYLLGDHLVAKSEPAARPVVTTSTELRRLSVRFRSQVEYPLSDRSHTTTDRTAAMMDPPPAPAAAHDASRVATAALLRLPPGTPGPPTPARLEWVERLAAAELLPSAVVQDLRPAGRLGDSEWGPRGAASVARPSAASGRRT